MIGILVRLIAYPLTLILSLAAFLIAVMFGAQAAPHVWLLTLAAFAIFFGVIYFAAKFIERKSASSQTIAVVLAATLTAGLSVGLWALVGTPGDARAETGTPQPYWTLADGSRIAYQRCGDDDASPPLIFLHGGPAVPPRQSSIDTVCQLGSAGRAVYLYDQIGSGRSSRLSDISGYTLERHVEDLEAIRQQLGVEQFDIIGVSWGTVLASHYIARYPGRVRRVVYVSPGILGSRSDIDYDYSASASSDYDGVVLPPARIIVAGLLARANSRLALQFMPQAEAEAAMDLMVQHPSLEYQGRCKGASIDLGGTRGEGANYYANLIAAQSLRRADDPSAAIASSGPPALLLRGVCDYIPRSALERYQAAYRVSAILDVNGEGHSFLGSRADVVVPAAACWLAAADVNSCQGVQQGGASPSRR